MSDESVGAILSEIHGLLHEARSNVELEQGQGQKLILRVSAAESAHSAGALTRQELDAVVRDVGDGITASIEKEISIDNPEAAVIQIRGLLDRLEQMA